MLSHATTRDWLIPYADGMLAADERRRIDAHLKGCGACTGELRQVRELNLLLVTLPAAPPLAFAPFWLKLQAVLPLRRAARPSQAPALRRFGFALAAATVAALMATGTALAAPSAMPDSALYPVKQLEEGLRMAVTSSHDRLAVQLDLANERLREAKAMSLSHKPELVANSLRGFRLIIDDAADGLKHQIDPEGRKKALGRLRERLNDVERANVDNNDDESTVKQLVSASIDELDRIDVTDQDAVVDPPLVIGQQSTPTPKPTRRPTPRPEPSDEERHH
jgi:predicted anti-sigma-YlaC factor YlaD